MVQFLRDYRYEIIAGFAGAVVMILELVGARMVAPFFGTSIYVWTAMIGVILGSLSLGYWYGGILADRSATDRGLMCILFAAAIAILLSITVQETVLRVVSATGADIRLATLFAATVLFAPAASFLGVVSPYLAKLRLSSLKKAGQQIGRLYAAGTFGSIAGTFLAGYWLIGSFGNRTLAFSLVVLLVVLSFAAYRRGWLAGRGVVGSLAFLGIFMPYSLPFGVLDDVDSAYSRYIITETQESRPVRSLVTDPFSVQSSQFVGEPDVIALEYTKRFMTVTEAISVEDIVIIGGGAYTFPHAAARAYPELDVSVVEIDPKLTDLARQYFSLEQRDNLHIHHEDGRVFLNKAAPAQYDIVFLDAFSSLTPPYQLSTVEATRAAKGALKEHGLIVANVIAAPEDPYGEAVAATYRYLFRYVDFYQVYPLLERTDRQNLIVVMTDDEAQRERARKALNTAPASVHDGLIMTDDFAPVEQLINH